MTNIDLFELISKEYVGTLEIKKIINLSGGKCGVNKAQKIRREIEQECEDYLLPSYEIPTEKLLKKLNMSIKKIHDKALMEKELGGIKQS